MWGSIGVLKYCVIPPIRGNIFYRRLSEISDFPIRNIYYARLSDIRDYSTKPWATTFEMYIIGRRTIWRCIIKLGFHCNYTLNIEQYLYSHYDKIVRNFLSLVVIKSFPVRNRQVVKLK